MLKKKKLLCMLMCIMMVFSMYIPVFGSSESLDQELTRVTLSVKNALSISDKYTDFHGDVDDMGALRYWTLNWSDAGGTGIQVIAQDSGKIVQYSANSSGPIGPWRGTAYDPAFSKVTLEQARKTALEFLGKVLAKNEGVDSLESDNLISLASNDSNYTISAQILLNGIPSPTSVNIQISRQTGEVIFYSRDDAYKAYVNEAPANASAVSAATASDTLAGTVNLTLQYVLSDEGKGTKAVLRYVPSTESNYYVDAQTGKLVDLTEAWKNLNEAGTMDSAKSTASGGGLIEPAANSELSDAEQSAIKQMQGVMSQDALDAAARKVTALGLGRYTLSNTSFSADKKSGDVTCTLNYTRKIAFSELNDVTEAQYSKGTYVQSKEITVNAKTGALLEGWSYRPWYMKEVKIDRKSLQPAADSFLAFRYPELAGKTKLIDADGSDFRYDQIENGYYYHDNFAQISIDPTDGSVASFSKSWNDALTFESADGIVSAKDAKDAYCGAYTAKLKYIAYPVAVDATLPVWKTFSNCCGPIAYKYVLGYTYETEAGVILGVNAKTGKPVVQPVDKAFAYTDIANSFAKKQIEALADAGIGFGASTEFHPAAKLTEKDMLVLLLNATGCNFDAENLTDPEQLTSLYNAAWSQGFLVRGNRNPEHIVTRLEMVKSVISASSYAQAAKLKGIYVTSYTDAAKIPADSLGYAAIAQGLGMIRGDAMGRFNPDTEVTRQVAAVVLYNYMNR